MPTKTNKGITQGQTNVHGQKVADVVAEEQADEILAAFDQDQLDIERSRTFMSLSFTRTRTEWSGEYAVAIRRMKQEIEQVIQGRFSEAYAVMFDLYEVVREHEVDEETGEVKVDDAGLPIWRKTELGSYVEDWTKLTIKQREQFLFRIMTSLFAWQQDAAELWGEAMFAKAIWTESFSRGFDAPLKGTVDDRTARGNLDSAEDRYFAVYLSLLSKRADALCQSLERIALRLKDTMNT